ncbi:MAG: hypothetical protein AVDCRST_MAG56-7302, partial [uncultured Cytophagales bacterium]
WKFGKNTHKAVRKPVKMKRPAASQPASAGIGGGPGLSRPAP